MAPEVRDRVLILKSTWLSLILQGRKTMELRGRRAEVGWIWLATGSIVKGRARIAACQKLTDATFAEYMSLHQVYDAELPYAKTWALWLEDVAAVPEPIQFFKPWGSVGWVRFRFCATDLPTKPKQQRTGACRVKGGRRGRLAVKGAGLTESVGKEGGLPNIGNTCFVNSVLQGILHMPDVIRTLERAKSPCRRENCLWSLLRDTMLARDAGQADTEHMRRWLPVVREHGLDISQQDSALLFASAICETLREQQAGGPGTNGLL